MNENNTIEISPHHTYGRWRACSAAIVPFPSWRTLGPSGALANNSACEPSFEPSFGPSFELDFDLLEKSFRNFIFGDDSEYAESIPAAKSVGEG